MVLHKHTFPPTLQADLVTGLYSDESSRRNPVQLLPLVAHLNFSSNRHPNGSSMNNVTFQKDVKHKIYVSYTCSMSRTDQQQEK